MFANLIIGLSVGIATLVMLDVLLSDRQKQHLSDVLVRVWNFMDDWKREAQMPLPRAMVVGVSGLTLIAFTIHQHVSTNLDYQGNPLGIEGDFVATIVACSAFAIGTVGSLLLPRWFFPWGQYGRKYVAPAILIAALLAPATLVVFSSAASIGMVSLTLVFTIVASIFLSLTAFLPLVFAQLFAYLLWAIEFVIRRIAEYPKGPILGASIVFGALAALIKALS